jgi:hypothetical protein
VLGKESAQRRQRSEHEDIGIEVEDSRDPRLVENVLEKEGLYRSRELKNGILEAEGTAILDSELLERYQLEGFLVRIDVAIDVINDQDDHPGVGVMRQE